MADSKKKVSKKKVKVGEKKSIEDGKTKVEDVEGDAPEESAGEEVAATPAHVEDDIVTVRGHGAGGSTQMPRSEFEKSKFAGAPAAEADEEAEDE